jgi:membrane-associated phospholipid phosphatase
MMRHGLIELPPSELDLRLARGAARIARPWLERDAQALTLLADEKLLLAVAGGVWLGTRLAGGGLAQRRADHLLLASAVSAALPHLLKQVVRRKRPDRSIATAPWQGVPRSGKPYNAFPSGHAMHLGAWASALAHWLPLPWRWAPWTLALALSGTRLLLLAHWPSDVALGFVTGIGLDRAVRRGMKTGADRGA